MNTILIYPIAIPLIAGLVCLILPRRFKLLGELLALVTTLVNIGIGVYLYNQIGMRLNIPWFAAGDFAVSFDLLITPFARLVLIAGSIFACLILTYSHEFLRDNPRQSEFFAYALVTLGCAAGAVLANNLVLLLVFWDVLGLMLYLMVMIAGSEAIPSATKTLVIAVTGDMGVLLGIAFIWLQNGSLTISDIAANPLVLDKPIMIAAYLLIMIGAFAKAGAMPLHSWIPAIATTAPMPTMAYLPASLDKLLGIYLLALISLNLFVMTPAISLVLMCVGAITILGAVLMALIQHDFRKMLAFHAVSQVGYMVMGIGTGVPIGVIGGLFHMLNHSIYKSCLFLCGGSVQKQTGRTEFADLGGLAKAMPWTFATALIAALAISGVPPMNGFVSKWLIYQGILEHGGNLFPIFLGIAMFGSALTLASFMKLLYSMFWGSKPKDLEQVKEARPAMIIPLVVLAGFCIAFGIFYAWPITNLIIPLAKITSQSYVVAGLWQSQLATVLLAISLLAGVPIYLLGRPKETRQAEVFLGGETMDPELYRVPGSHFYGPVKEFAGLKQLFALGEKGDFDLYNYTVRGTNWAARMIYQYFDQALGDFYQEVIPSLLSLIGQILRELNSRLVLTYVMWFLYAAAAFGMWLRPVDANIAFMARIIACIGMVGWAVLAAVETDLRRLLTLAATSQFGFVLLGLSFTPYVAASYLFTGSFALAVLFLIGYLISQVMKTSDINGMNGLAARKPVYFLCFMLAALWLSGLPPFGSFFSKYQLGVAAGEISPFLTIVITGTALLTLGYLLRPIRRFLRPV
jgi:formate hydrogenlyase subunit 3/multisubunit Na+/H+ antiporter MnhD subunit